MACSAETFSTPWNHIGAANVNPTPILFIPLGPWMPATNLTSARGYGEMRGRNGTFQGQPAIQFANDTRSPGTAIACGPNMNADGFTDPNGNQSMSGASPTARFCRVGVLVSVTSAGFSSASMSLIFELIRGT